MHESSLDWTKSESKLEGSLLILLIGALPLPLLSLLGTLVLLPPLLPSLPLQEVLLLLLTPPLRAGVKYGSVP